LPGERRCLRLGDKKKYPPNSCGRRCTSLSLRKKKNESSDRGGGPRFFSNIRKETSQRRKRIPYGGKEKLSRKSVDSAPKTRVLLYREPEKSRRDVAAARSAPTLALDARRILMVQKRLRFTERETQSKKGRAKGGKRRFH